MMELVWDHPAKAAGELISLRVLSNRLEDNSNK
jgi:hypothetical protein